MDTTRTFVAIALPDSLGSRLSRLQADLAAEVSGVRWVSDSHFHVTLAFLGDVPNTDLNNVCRAVENAAADIPPLELRVEGLGLFGNPKRPRSLWIGVDGADVRALGQLQSGIAAALKSTGYGVDEGPFHPHVTL